MRTRAPCLALCLSLLSVACGGKVAPEGEGLDEPGASVTGASGSAGDSPAATGALACSEVEQGELSLTSEAAFIDAIAGTWTQCSAVSVFGTNEQGLEITADGHWYKLRVSGGSLQRSAGFDEQGTWTVLDTSVMNGPGHYQLNLDIDGSGTVITLPALSKGPRKMRLDNMGVFRGDYAIDP